eukprot:1820592-Amphidinium_carterae.1
MAFRSEGLAEACTSERELVLAAVSADGTALEFFPSFQRNHEVVLAAVSQKVCAIWGSPSHAAHFTGITHSLFTETVLSFILGTLLHRLPLLVVLRRSRKLLLVPKGCALEYAAVELQNHRDVVLAAVVQDGLALQYASHSCRSDAEVVFVA